MRNILTQQQGFTFVEALFQLFVLMILTQLILSHQLMMKTYTHTFYSDDVQWEMFVNDMQRYIDAHPSPFTIEFERRLTRKVYDAEAQKEVSETFDMSPNGTYIRRQYNSGNEPLLYGVQRLAVSMHQGRLLMRVTFLDGRIKERVLDVPLEG